MRTIWASTVSAPTRSARMTRPPVPLTVPPITRSPGPFLDRDRLAADHRLVDRACPSTTIAVDRNLSRPGGPGADRRGRPGRAEHPPRDRRLTSRRAVLGARPEQGADGTAGLAARPQLENLTQENQGHDHRRRLEINGDFTMMIAERGGKNTGKKRGDHTEHKSRPGPQCDQCEHIQTAVDHRGPAALEEWQPAPQRPPASPGQAESIPRSGRRGRRAIPSRAPSPPSKEPGAAA